MFYETEYPKVYSASHIVLNIFSKPIVWFKPTLTGLGQLILYRFKVRPNEKSAANQMDKKIIKMRDQTEIMIGISSPSPNPRAIVIYLHTVCGNYKQLSHIQDVLKSDNIAYITYTRGGNDPSLNFSKFNFVGRIEELQIVINYIKVIYPNTPIHAIGASAGSALLIRYLGKFNSDISIKSAALISPGYNFMKSFNYMNRISKAYLVNKMKYMLRNIPCREELKSINTLDDWLEFQSRLLGYHSPEEYMRDCDPVHYLRKINVPTIFVSALDDSVFSGEITKMYLNLPAINPNITIVTTKYGGHVMFEDDGHDYPWFIRLIQEWLINRIVGQ